MLEEKDNPARYGARGKKICALTTPPGFGSGRGARPFCQGSLMRLIPEAHVFTEGAVSKPLRPRRDPSLRPSGSGSRWWRGLRYGASPLLLGLLLFVLPSVAGADPLLDEANDLKDGDACDAALPLYEQLFSHPDPDVTDAARYNAAVCLEWLGRPAEARSHYDALVQDSRALRPDALFRRALLDVVPGSPTREARRDLRRARRLSRDPLAKALIDLQLARLDSLEGRSSTRRLVRAGEALATAGDDAERDRRGAPLDWYRGEAALVRATLFLAEAEGTDLGLRGRGLVTERMKSRSDALATAEGHVADAVAAGRGPWPQMALRDLGDAWLATAEALEALHLEASAWEGRRPTRPEALALAAFLEARLDAPWGKARHAYELCVQAELELGDAPSVGQACRERLDALAERHASE